MSVAEVDLTRRPPLVRWTVTILAAFIPLAAFAAAVDLPRQLGFVLYKEQVLAAVLAASLALGFLTMRSGGGSGGRIPWYDWIAAVAGLTATGYIAVNYQTITFLMPYRPVELVIVGGLILILMLEAVRRTAGLGLACVVAFFTAYASFGDHLPSEVSAQHVSPDRLAIYLSLDPNGLLGTPLMIAVMVVSLFILFGNWLTAAGGTHFFTDIAMALMGRYRGGAAKVSVAGSMLFGSISGSAVANVMATGVVTVPTMIRSGFPRVMAGAVEAVASTGGQLAPPIMGAAAFLMAEFMQVSYGTIILSAIIPAVFYYFSLFVAVDLTAAREGVEGLDPSTLPRKRDVLAKGWFFIVPFVVLLGTLFLLNERPERAVAYASAIVVICGFLIGYDGERITGKGFLSAIVAAGEGAMKIVILCAAAGVVIGAINISGIGFALTVQLVNLAGVSLSALLLVAAGLCIILGMGMPSTGVYVLLAALMVPALVRAGVDPLPANFFVFYFGMLSMITPPIALASFAAASISGVGSMRTALESCRLGWVAYIVPFLFVYSPALLMQGSIAEIVTACATGLIGICLISATAIGFSVRPIGLLERVLYAVAGCALLAHISENLWSSLALNGAGAALALVLVARDLKYRSP